MKKTKFAHAGASVLEKVVGEFALPLAALSATQDGNAFERAVGGVTTAASAAYHGIESYVFNSGVRETINSGVVEATNMVGNLGSNLYDHPMETLSTVAGTYAVMKIGPYVSKKMRHRQKAPSAEYES